MILVAKAYVGWLLGVLRGLTRAGMSWAAFGRLLAWQLGAIRLGRGDARVRVLLDESAAHLRELGELSVQEALALRKLLNDLLQQLRQLDSSNLDHPRRFAKVKR